MLEKPRHKTLPDVLSPEWRRHKADAALYDLKTLLADMGSEDRARLEAELGKLSKGDLSSQEKLGE